MTTISKVVVGRYDVYEIYMYVINSWKNVKQKNSNSSALYVDLHTYATEKQASLYAQFALWSPLPHPSFINS